MKKVHLALSLLSLTFLAACGGAAAASAAGVYDADKAMLKPALLASIPAEAQKDPKTMEAIDTMLKDMVLQYELKADNTVAFTMKSSMMGMPVQESATGTWKLESGKLTLVTKNKEGKEDTKAVDYANGAFTVEQESGGQKVKVTFKKK